MVHVCPRCELRFPTKPEVTHHLADEHDVEAAATWLQPRDELEGGDLPPLYPPDPHGPA